MTPPQDWFVDDQNLPVSEMGFETMMLEKIKLGVKVALAKELFHGIQVRGEMWADDVANQIALSMIGEVWSDPSQEHRQTVEITTPPAFKSWRHHRLASLSGGSFKRRFLERLWGLEGEELAEPGKTYRVEVHVPAVLPELQRKLPDDFGRYHFPIQMRRV